MRNSSSHLLEHQLKKKVAEIIYLVLMILECGIESIICFFDHIQGAEHERLLLLEETKT